MSYVCSLCRRSREHDWQHPNSFANVVDLCDQCEDAAIKTLTPEIRAAVLAVIAR